MRDVYLVGAAQSDFGAFPRESYGSLFGEAFVSAVDSIDGEFDKSTIDEAFVGTLGVVAVS